MKTVMLTLAFLNIVLTSFAQEHEVLDKYLEDSLTVITQRVEKKIIKARYMEQQLVRTTDTLKGWEGVKVSLYRYKVKDKVKGTLEAEVYMLNPDAKKLAAWVISTCVITTGKLDKKNTDTIIQSVRSASGGQFPVLGIVYEDMDGKGFKPYFFKDGVTVFLKKSDVIDISQINDDNIKGTGKYARIISTTREEYIRKYGAANLEGTLWLAVVQQAYKAAMNANTNTLFIAWANGKLH
jgi:endoglucanase